MVFDQGKTGTPVPAVPQRVHAPLHADAPKAAAARPLQVLASTQPPVPMSVVCLWLRKKAAMGVPVIISPLLAQRIAAELEEHVV